uniref:Membrane cofactor protein-like n=1 Tax=Nothoprocta perdicaria TaxID=30464 RepID=A0A8C7ECQ3_NOTPE
KREAGGACAVRLVGPRAAGECTSLKRLHYAEPKESYQKMQSFPSGTTVSYVCRPGYRRIPGKSLAVTCMDSQWLEPEPFCTEKSCSRPEDLEHGSAHIEDLKFGSSITFSCEEGYRLRGASEISCVIKGADVGWSENLPFCEQIPCKPPPSIANGLYDERESYVYQTTVTYRCVDVPKGMDRFSLIGSDSIFCTHDADNNGIWSGPPPECRVVKCDNLQVQHGKKITGFGPSYSYKDSITFECDPGYSMKGSQTISCLENSTWHPPKPTCVKNMCAAPEITDGELIPLKTQYSKGESVRIKCNAQCTLPDGAGEMTVTCEGGETWSSLQNCTCRVVDPNPHISHGRIIAGLKSSYSVGDVITIECYAGYTLHGEANIQYSGENRWTPEVPTCHLSKYELQKFPLALKMYIMGGLKRDSTPCTAKYTSCTA